MERDVVSYETAKKLKVAGWQQGHPRNHWSDDYKITYSWFVWAQPGSYRKDEMLDQWAVYEREEGWFHHEGKHPWFAAPTVQEIMDKLPRRIHDKGTEFELIMRSPLDNDYRFHYCGATGRYKSDYMGSGAIGVGPTVAEALAQLLLKLVEYGDVKL